MKKSIALLLALVLCLGLFAGCVEKPSEDPNLAAAKEYLAAMYEKEEGTKTTRSFSRVAVVRIDGTSYDVEWSVKVTSGDEKVVQVVKNDDKTVTVQIAEEVPNETVYQLIATIKGENEQTETLTFNHTVPKVPTAKEILDMAYALETGKELDGTYKLTGVITKIDTPWDANYKNITVTIVCGEDTERPVQCFRLAGTDADKLAVGDTITVEGKLKNYNGTVEFDAKCQLLKRVPGEGGDEKPVEGYDPTGKTAEEIVDAAWALEIGQAFAKPATLTGKVVSVDTPYSEQYSNVTVTLAVEGKEDKPIVCFRMKGEGADVVKAGDTITVTGIIKNYQHSDGTNTIEYDAGCTLDKLNGAENEGSDKPNPNPDPKPNPDPVDLTTPAGIVKAAFALEDGKYLADGQEFTLTGVVTKLGDVTTSNDRHVNFTVEGKDFYCYYLKGSVEKIQVGDTITVKGKIKNYKGTIEFDKGQLVSGGTGSGSGSTDKPATEPACVTTPEIGKAYKMGLWQSVKGDVYYFTGTMSSYYGATSTNKAEAVDIYLEDAGNYYLYFMSGDTKNYIYGEQSGTHLNFKFGTTKGVFTWNAAASTFTTTIGEATVFMGTYSNYVTFGMSPVDKLETSYAAHLYN